MSIKPIDERLNDIIPTQPGPQPTMFNSTDMTETVLESGNTEPLNYEPSDVSDAEPVQVAGIGSLKNLFTKTPKDIVKEAGTVIEPVKPPQPVIEAKKAETILQKTEQTIDTTPATGKPPEQLINVDKIEGPDDFKQMVNSMAGASGIEVQGMTWEQTIALAAKKGLNNVEIADLQKMKAQYANLPPDIVRLRVASYVNSKEAYDLARQAYLNPDNQDLMAKLLYKINLQTSINEAYVAVRTRAAQGTAAGGIQITENMAADIAGDMANLKLPAANSAEMKKMLADPNISGELKVLVEKMEQLTDEAAKAELINKVSKVGLIRDLWDRTWKNGLLSATGTHIVNIASNTSFLASSLATRQLAEFISVGKRMFGGKGEIELGETAAMMAGLVHSWRDGMKLGWEAVKTGTTREMREGTSLLSDAGKKLEGQYNVFNAKDYGVENEMLVKGINGYSQVVTLLGGRPIMAMDEVFKTMGYRAELYAQAYRQQIKTKRDALRAGKSAEEAESLGLEAMGNILNSPPAEIDELAKDFSHMITFSRKLTGNSASVQKFAQETLLGRIMLPFVKTPVWITSESMQHSLFAPLSKQWRSDIAAGGSKRELAMAKMGMGSGVMIGVGSMVADGRMTGGGPGNNALKQQYLASGWRPYSFVFQKDEWDQEFVDYLKTMRIDPGIGQDGKLYVPFRGIDPIAGPLAMVADAVEYARYEDDQDKVGQIILGATWGLYSYVGQMPFMTAMQGFAGAFTQNIPNPKAAFRNAIDAVVKQGTSYAIEGSPAGIFNSARGMVSRGFDPIKRDVRDDPNLPTGVKGFYEAWNYFASRTPGLSQDLPETYDLFGRLAYRGDPAAPWISSASGIRYSESKQSAADKVVISLGLPLQPPRGSIGVQTEFGSVNVKLTPKEEQEWKRNIGMVVDGNGHNIEQAIVVAVSRPGFELLDKDEQQNMVKEVYGEFVQMAKDMLLETRPAIQIRADAAGRKLPIYGNPK